MCSSSHEKKTKKFSSVENTKFGVPTCSVIEAEDEMFFLDWFKNKEKAPFSFRDNLQSFLDSKSDVREKIKYIDSVEKHQEGIQSNVQSHSQTAGGGDQEEDGENETEEDDDGDGETEKENQHSVFEMDYLESEEVIRNYCLGQR